MERRALDGVKVVDITQLIAGPLCGRMLADLGAEIIKIDRLPSPNGGPVRSASAGPALNLGKRSIAIDLLATLHAHTGDLNKVTRIVKLMSLVNSTLDFTEQHVVTNGASELIAEVFGDAGKHARSAFGVAQIPLGACVEIELIAEVA